MHGPMPILSRLHANFPHYPHDRVTEQLQAEPIFSLVSFIPWHTSPQCAFDQLHLSKFTSVALYL